MPKKLKSWGFVWTYVYTMQLKMYIKNTDTIHQYKQELCDVSFFIFQPMVLMLNVKQKYTLAM